MTNPQSAQWKVRTDGSGLHLFNRSSGTNVLLEGLHAPRAKWSRAPRSVSIALLNACDLRCAYCYAPKFAARLGTAALLGWLSELDRNGCLSIGFGGGEPTLRPDLPEICGFVMRETGMAVTMTTHGHHLSTDLVRRLRGRLHFVRVSMDGTYSVYERHRNRPFADLLASLARLRDLAPFGINVVVNDDTVECLDQVAEIALEVGAAEILLLPQQPTRALPGISSKAMRRLAAWIAEPPARVRLAISGRGLAGGIPIANPFASEDSPLANYAHISADGQLKQSSFDVSGVRIDARGVMDAIGRLELTRHSNRELT